MSWPSPSPDRRRLISVEMARMASRPRVRSMGMEPTFQAYQPMIGTRITSRFMMKARRGTAWAMARMSRKHWCLAATMQSPDGGVPRTSQETPRCSRAAHSI